MAPTKHTAGKKASAKKSPRGKWLWCDEEKNSSITLSNEAVVKKLAIRQSFESAPNLQADIRLIWVGSPPQLSTIHSALLPVKTHAILDASIYQPWPGSPVDFYTVNDTTHETFGTYRSFLYTGKLFSHDAEGDQDYADNGNDEAHEDREWMRLALAYFLGLRLGDEKFCNTVVDGIVEKMAEADRSPTGLATEVYAHTTQGDKLRALLVDLHVWKGLGTWINPPHDDANGPMYFRRDVRSGVRKAGSAIHDENIPMPWEVDLCQYHTHNDTAACERKPAKGPQTSVASLEESAPPTTPRRSPRKTASPLRQTKVCKPQAQKKR